MNKTALILIMLVISLNSAYAQESFNLELTLPKTYQTASPGHDIFFTTNLLNLGTSNGRLDVTLKYDLINNENKIIATKSKTVAIETQASFVENIKIPNDAKSGKYILKATLNSPAGESTTEINLTIKKDNNLSPLYGIFVALFLIALITLLVFILKPVMKKIELKSKINRIVKEKFKLIRKK